MADRLFDTELEAWFADSPILPDAGAFAARVSDRLERAWTFRRFMIGGLGVAGGLIGGAQVLESGLLGRLGAVEARTGAVSRTLAEHIQDSPLARSSLAHGAHALFSSLGGADTRMLWMSLAMALFAGGLLMTRAIREF